MLTNRHRNPSFATLVLWATLAATSSVVAAQPSPEVVVHLADAGAASRSDVRRFPFEAGQAVVAQALDLGETIEGGRVELRGESLSSNAYRVEVQYETSVTIMNAGPHLDLLDWRHFTSQWRVLATNADGSFLIPAFSQQERTQFPEIQIGELVSAVGAAGGERWASLVGELTGPNQYPGGVDISTIRLRVVPVSDDGAASPFTVEFRLPMGC